MNLKKLTKMTLIALSLSLIVVGCDDDDDSITGGGGGGDGALAGSYTITDMVQHPGGDCSDAGVEGFCMNDFGNTEAECYSGYCYDDSGSNEQECPDKMWNENKAIWKNRKFL